MCVPQITKTEEQEIIAAEITIGMSGKNISDMDIEAELDRVNRELNRYVSNADKADYAFAVFSGVLAGAIDVLFVGEAKVNQNEFNLSREKVNNFIIEYAQDKGYKGAGLSGAIRHLEETFKVAQDNIWSGKNIRVSAMNHHLADLAHHPTPLGLISAIAVQFLRFGTFVNREGDWRLVFVGVNTEDMKDNKHQIVAAIITGILNWLVMIAENKYEEAQGKEIPKALRHIMRLVASTPMLIEIADCANNWFGHLVSDMGGSYSTAGRGMGIPSIFASLLHELSGLPILKDSGLPAYVNNLYVNQKWDLRHELAYVKEVGKQTIPILFNEIFVRTGFFVTRLAIEIQNHRTLKEVNWGNVIPFQNRTVDRMMTVASMTFTVADTADAAVRAALESGGNWILFAGHFSARFNYIGAGRAAFAIVKELSYEKKEAQLLHEKRILTEAKTQFTIQQLEAYKSALEEQISKYIAEDIETIISGFNYMDQGLLSGNSDLVIRGNVAIQRVLGREPQFTNQEEFNDLMDSDMPLIF